MCTRRTPRGSWMIGLGLLLLLVALVRITSPAAAQCEQPPPSSCATCHTLQHPVSTQGEWHQIHSRQDLCLNCHGGNGSTPDKELAHESMNAQPLSDIYTDCHSCHPDYDARADRFATSLGVTPASCPTPTAAPLNGLGAHPRRGQPDLLATGRGGFSALARTGLLAAGFAALAFFIYALRWLDNHNITPR